MNCPWINKDYLSIYLQLHRDSFFRCSAPLTILFFSFSLGGSKEDSDVDEGSPPRKRRKAPTRTSARSSPQVTFVSDKGVPGKSPQSSSAKAKGRKQ